MNKIFSAVPLTVLAGLLLTGCAGGESTPEPSTEVSASPIQGRLSQNIEGEQSQKLISELEKIDPALANERSVSRANRVCDAIVAGESEDVQIRLVKTLLSGPGKDAAAATDEKAKSVIEVLKVNNFCVTK